MIVLLDTDHISIMQQESEAQASLQRRLGELPGERIHVSIVSFQEQTRGWLAYINRARKREQLLKGFAELFGLLTYYRAERVLPFDEAAIEEFEGLQQQRIRIGTNDLRIAAIAKANRVTLLTRNIRDFRLVPGLDTADWTV